MAKCGHDVCPDDNCNLKHLFNQSKLIRCRKIQGCIETSCSSLKIYEGGFALYDACIGHCHREWNDPKNPNNYDTMSEYACANFDPVVLADNFGANICNVPIEQTKVGEVQTQQNKLNTQQQKQLTAVFVIVLALLAIFLITRK